MRLEERHIYGSARLGMNTSRVEWEFDLDGAETTLTTIAPNQHNDAGSVEHFIGNKQYELSNHLGNVLSVISDIKTPVASGTVVSYYESVVISSQDYSPFGVTLEGRSWSAGYRYGFNGKEKDPEGMGGGGNTYDYGFRIYNANLAKFLSVDPLSASYSWYTPYQFAGNKPIWAIDVDGLEEYYSSSGELIGKYGESVEQRIVFDEDVNKVQHLMTAQTEGRPEASVLNAKIYNDCSAPLATNPDEAASIWGNKMNPRSIEDNREYSSWIFYTKINGDGYFSYTKPQKGEKDNVKSQYTIKKGRILFGQIHTHGAFDEDYDNNNFSDELINKEGEKVLGDIGNYKLLGITGYVVTPNGSLQKWQMFIGTVLLSCEMPCDPNDPESNGDCSSDIAQPEIPQNH